MIASTGNTIKISIITAVYNRRRTVSAAIESVLQQDYDSIEYIVVDGMSDDGTDEVIQQHKDRIDIHVREPDDGIYDALNKGIGLATGDVIGFLHADDLLAHSSVIRSIADKLQQTEADACYGDLLYVNAEDPQKVVRYWKSGEFARKRVFYGWMPPHPTCYIKRSVYETAGKYRTDMSIAADYELLIRMMVKGQIPVAYVDDILVKMRVGGKSNRSLKNRLLANREDALAWKHNDLSAPMLLRFMKPLRKIGQYINKPSNNNR